MGLAALCVRRPVFTTMLIVALVVLGLISFRELGVDLFPKVDFPTVTVMTALPGASAEEMESEVTRPMEEVINTIQGIDELRSVSREGVSLVIVSFVLERDSEQATQDVRDKVSTILGQLPEGVDPPIINKEVLPCWFNSTCATQLFQQSPNIHKDSQAIPSET